MLDIAHKILRGCGAFALIVGGLSGLTFALLASHESGAIDPAISQQVFVHGLLGRLPTLLVASFILLRVNFQLATDPGLARRLHDGHQTGAYVGACALVSLIAWMWFFLSALAGSWLGMMQGFSGYGHAVWESFWMHCEFTTLAHAAVRMLLLAACLSGLTFFEMWFMRQHEERSHQMMSRAMTLGMLTLITIEIGDFLWLLHQD